MPGRTNFAERNEMAVDAHLLGMVDFDECLALQQRLVDDACAGSRARGVILLCEHPTLITIGRSGSRLQARMSDRELAARNIDIRWVGRGGGAIPHAPGQLAVYTIVPLEALGVTVAEFVGRIQSALIATLAEMRVPAEARGGEPGAWGRTGQIGAVGISVQNGVAFHGAFINVSPALDLFRRVGGTNGTATGMSSLVAERPRGVRMAAVRESAARHFAEICGGGPVHLYAGHPWIDRAVGTGKRTERAG